MKEVAALSEQPTSGLRRWPSKSRIFPQQRLPMCELHKSLADQGAVRETCHECDIKELHEEIDRVAKHLESQTAELQAELTRSRAALLEMAGRGYAPKDAERHVVNGNATPVWRDPETGRYVAEFMAMVASGDTAEDAIKSLQMTVAIQAGWFTEKIALPEFKPAATERAEKAEAALLEVERQREELMLKCRKRGVRQMEKIAALLLRAEAAEQRWIPVSEKLPQNSKLVIVYDEGWGAVYITSQDDGAWEQPDGREPPDKITHWRELPAAPLVEREG